VYSKLDPLIFIQRRLTEGYELQIRLERGGKWSEEEHVRCQISRTADRDWNPRPPEHEA